MYVQNPISTVPSHLLSSEHSNLRLYSIYNILSRRQYLVSFIASIRYSAHQPSRSTSRGAIMRHASLVRKKTSTLRKHLFLPFPRGTRSPMMPSIVLSISLNSETNPLKSTACPTLCWCWPIRWSGGHAGYRGAGDPLPRIFLTQTSRKAPQAPRSWLNSPHIKRSSRSTDIMPPRSKYALKLHYHLATNLCWHFLSLSPCASS
jgi:hypothetical protein